MRKNFPAVLDLLHESEGGYVNHPRDPGGHTNRGVTLRTFQDVYGSDQTVSDLKNITQRQVESVYYQRYWKPTGGNVLASGLDYCVFDYGVNSGPRRAVKALQRIVGAKEDGQFGPNTAKATYSYLTSHTAAELIDAICDQRMAFLQRLAHWETFKRGWTKRVARVRMDSKAWAAPATEEATEEPDVYSVISGIIGQLYELLLTNRRAI